MLNKADNKIFTILVVEDDTDLSFTQKEILSYEGYNVLTALTGREALKIVERQDIDLVLLDLKLPDISGQTILAAIKRHRPDIKVLIITGYEDVNSYIETMQHGAEDYMIKPVPPTVLTTVLKKIRHRMEAA